MARHGVAERRLPDVLPGRPAARRRRPSRGLGIPSCGRRVASGRVVGRSSPALSLLVWVARHAARASASAVALPLFLPLDLRGRGPGCARLHEGRRRLGCFVARAGGRNRWPWRPSAGDERRPRHPSSWACSKLARRGGAGGEGPDRDARLLQRGGGRQGASRAGRPSTATVTSRGRGRCRHAPLVSARAEGDLGSWTTGPAGARRYETTSSPAPPFRLHDVPLRLVARGDQGGELGGRFASRVPVTLPHRGSGERPIATGPRRGRRPPRARCWPTALRSARAPAAPHPRRAPPAPRAGGAAVLSSRRRGPVHHLGDDPPEKRPRSGAVIASRSAAQPDLLRITGPRSVSIVFQRGGARRPRSRPRPHAVEPDVEGVRSGPARRAGVPGAVLRPWWATREGDDPGAERPHEDHVCASGVPELTSGPDAKAGGRGRRRGRHHRGESRRKRRPSADADRLEPALEGCQVEAAGCRGAGCPRSR
jgi:hypothetical protein